MTSEWDPRELVHGFLDDFHAKYPNLDISKQGTTIFGFTSVVTRERGAAQERARQVAAAAEKEEAAKRAEEEAQKAAKEEDEASKEKARKEDFERTQKAWNTAQSAYKDRDDFATHIVQEATLSLACWTDHDKKNPFLSSTNGVVAAKLPILEAMARLNDAEEEETKSEWVLNMQKTNTLGFLLDTRFEELPHRPQFWEANTKILEAVKGHVKFVVVRVKAALLSHAMSAMRAAELWVDDPYTIGTTVKSYTGESLLAGNTFTDYINYLHPYHKNAVDVERDFTGGVHAEYMIAGCEYEAHLRKLQKLCVTPGPERDEAGDPIPESDTRRRVLESMATINRDVLGSPRLQSNIDSYNFKATLSNEDPDTRAWDPEHYPYFEAALNFFASRGVTDRCLPGRPLSSSKFSPRPVMWMCGHDIETVKALAVLGVHVVVFQDSATYDSDRCRNGWKYKHALGTLKSLYTWNGTEKTMLVANGPPSPFPADDPTGFYCASAAAYLLQQPSLVSHFAAELPDHMAWQLYSLLVDAAHLSPRNTAFAFARTHTSRHPPGARHGTTVQKPRVVDCDYALSDEDLAEAAQIAGGVSTTLLPCRLDSAKPEAQKPKKGELGAFGVYVNKETDADVVPPTHNKSHTQGV